MQYRKFKITGAGLPGFMVVTYHDNHFKSVLSEFNPPISEKQLSWIMKYITDDPERLQETFLDVFGGKLSVDHVTDTDFAIRDKIAMYCKYHEEKEGVKYKCGAAEAGKLKNITASYEEFDTILKVYFNSDEWFLKPKSISNLVKKYNEVRALVAKQDAVASYPLPYNENYYLNLDLNGKRAYHAFLKANGYVYNYSAVSGAKWTKSETLNKNQ